MDRDSEPEASDVEAEIAELELRLTRAKERLRLKRERPELVLHPEPVVKAATSSPFSPSHHFLLLLSDSALPLGSFALSSGLESYLAHSPRDGSIAAFLPISAAAYASTNLPFVLAAHRDPSASSVAALCDALDATVVCTVGRRASVAQGHALLAVWERSFAPALPGAAADVLRPFPAMLRDAAVGGAAADATDRPPPLSAHLAPLFGAVANLLGLSARLTAYLFILAHVKALVSAAVRVRAGMIGPFQAQKLLASRMVQDLVAAVVDREWETSPEDAGQTVPVMDLWIGRHEILYSRIFNS